MSIRNRLKTLLRSPLRTVLTLALLVAVSFVFVACAGEAYITSREPNRASEQLSPVVPSYASPTVSAPPSPEPSEPESWTGIYSAELPENSVAQIHVYNEDEDSFGFSVMWFEFVVSEDPEKWGTANSAGFSGTAKKGGNGIAIASVDSAIGFLKEVECRLISYEGNICLDYDVIQSWYETDSELPNNYLYRHDEDAAYAELPFSSLENGFDDTLFGLSPEQAAALFGEPLEYAIQWEREGEDGLKIATYEDAELHFYCPNGLDDSAWIQSAHIRRQGFEIYRGITIGDSFEEVVAKYPQSYPVDDWDGELTGLFYGDFLIHGSLHIIEETGEQVLQYKDGSYYLGFVFDSNGVLARAGFGPTA